MAPIGPFHIQQGVPAIVLAPMEGVTDHPFREFATHNAPFTHTVSDFLRVSQNVLPRRVIESHVPELANGSLTLQGVPVQLQLLGGNPDRLAQTALAAVRLGVQSIDMNFGCPSPTVNGNDGGATLLKFPNRIHEIIHTLRSSLPTHIPVSAKIRLGFDSCEPVFKNAEMAMKGGASWITIHARTRSQAYKPPVFWEYIRDVKKTPRFRSLPTAISQHLRTSNAVAI